MKKRVQIYLFEIYFHTFYGFFRCCVRTDHKVPIVLCSVVPANVLSRIVRIRLFLKQNLTIDAIHL